MLKEVKSQHSLGLTLDSKFTFESQLREVVSKAAESGGRLAGKLFDCPRVLKRYINAYVLSS